MPHYKFDQIAYNITDKKMPEPGDEKTYIGLQHLDSGSLKVTRWGNEVELKGQKLVMKKGDLLFGRRNTYLRRAAIAPHDGIFSAHGMIFRPKTEVIDPEYFPFFISSNYFMDAAIRISVGSLSPTVNWKTLKELEFDIPTLEEQKKNAELLKAINDTKEAYQELLLKTDDLVKSQFIEMFGDPNEPEHSVPFEQAFIIRDDLRKPINNTVRAEMHEDAKYPYYGANGQIDTINEYLMDCTALCLAEDGGSYGPGEKTSYIVHGKCWVNNHAHVLIPRENCNIKYANSFFRILDMSPYVSGTTRLKLTQRKMKEIPIVLPDYNLQKEYADFVEQSDKSKFELEQAIESTDNLIKSILYSNLEEKKE